MSTGEYRVGINFNPGGDDTVATIKRAAADLIDIVGEISDGLPPRQMPFHGTPQGDRSAEIMRLKALAQTAIEDGAMWAVKAATKREPEVAS